MIRPLFALALACAPVVAHAQIAPAPAAAPASLAKARELMTVMRAEDTIRKTIDAQAAAIGPGLTDQILRSGMLPPSAANDPDFRAIMQRHLGTILDASMKQVTEVMPQVIDTMTTIYAQEFTPKQIDDMIAFYRTPTGQAVLQKTPALTGQVAARMQNLTMAPLMKTLQSATPALMADLKAWAAKHPQAGATQQ